MSSLVIVNDDILTELSAKEPKNFETHGSDWTTDGGNMKVLILTDNQDLSPISWNSTTQVYDLTYMSQRLRVQVNATGLEPGRTFHIDWQLYGFINGSEAFGPLRHIDPMDPTNDLLSGRVSIHTQVNTSNYNTGILRGTPTGIPMNDNPTNLSGCYWVMATLSVQSDDLDLPHDIEIMQSNVSKRVSYGPGNQCPTDDQDGDGWSDAQEEQVGSLPNDPDSNPLTLLNQWQNMYNVCSQDSRVNSTNLFTCQSELEMCNSAFNETNSSLLSCIESNENNYTNYLQLLEQYNSLFENYNNSLGCNDCDIGCTACDESSFNSSTLPDNSGFLGGGNGVDLIAVGGASLITGFGISTVLNQSGSGRLNGSHKKKPNNIDVDDSFDELDIDLDLDKPKAEMRRPRIEEELDRYKREKTTPSTPIFILEDAVVDNKYSFDLTHLVDGSSIDDVFVPKTISGPDWLSLTLDGCLEGTPTVMDIGLAKVLVRVTNVKNLFADVEIRINVREETKPISKNQSPYWKS